jgi:hypothetical protein
MTRMSALISNPEEEDLDTQAVTRSLCRCRAHVNGLGKLGIGAQEPAFDLEHSLSFLVAGHHASPSDSLNPAHAGLAPFNFHGRAMLARVAALAQGRRGDCGENSEWDSRVTGAAPPVVAVVHPGQRELDIGEGLPGAGDDHGADFIQSPGRVPVCAWPVARQRRSVLVVCYEMIKLFVAEVAEFLEFFAQCGQMPNEPAAAD